MAKFVNFETSYFQGFCRSILRYNCLHGCTYNLLEKDCSALRSMNDTLGFSLHGNRILVPEEIMRDFC